MNTSRYIIARLFQSFGLHQKTRRLSDAADEMHLLKQAEEILGEDVWEEVEEIEEISVEYWNIRKLHMQRQKLKDQIADASDILSTSQEERNTALVETNQACQHLEEKRDTYTEEAKKLSNERDGILEQARVTRRKYEASKMKIQVLSEESADNKEVIQDEYKRLNEFKEEFAQLKEERDGVAVKIKDIEEKISKIVAIIEEDRVRLRNEASNAYQNIGKANQDMSKLVAEVGLIDVDLKEHYVAIGNYVSTNVGVDPICKKVCKQHTNLIAQMHSLRTSIALNHKLVSLAGG